MQQNKRRQFATEELIAGILNHDRIILAQAITLVESHSPEHSIQAQEVLSSVLPYTGNSIRIGITGVPGAGKSTLIETLGIHLIKQGRKVAVLAIDPSSSKSGGSILGDKTRMEKLAHSVYAFIRPSPSGGTLGGVAGKTRESILLCEAAGFDTIIVETMGVGQGEISVRSMVDFFLLLQIPGAGDELQGIKKGIMEIADAIVINKADGENKKLVLTAKREIQMALHYLASNTPGWNIPVLTCSALHGDGIPEIWSTINKFIEIKGGEELKNQRKKQDQEWMHDVIRSGVLELIHNNETIAKTVNDFENKIKTNKITPSRAAAEIIGIIKQKLEN